jgi:hypothetical protein
MRPVVALTDKAYGCGVRNVELLRLNPSPELLAKHLPKRPSKATIGGAGLFTRISP